MDHNIDTISNYMHGNSGLFDVSVDSVREFLMFMDYWVEQVVIYLEENVRRLLFRYIWTVYMTVCDEMKDIVVH